ncbi:MAG TPA: hypothetical protein VEU97_05595 [Ktedonobacteraceae bacterium]|nr:hypothetical protein [Ktedonobacteraceae bacterium]
MSKKDVTALPIAGEPIATAPVKIPDTSVRGVLICTAASILCTLISVTPLLHLAGKTFLLSLPTNPVLLLWGSWLPSYIRTAQTYRASMITTNDTEFLLLTIMAFIIYGLCAFFIRRQPPQASYSRVLRLIWLGTIIVGLIYLLTPAMLSRDIFVYAGYGRTIVAHHANPYFVTPSAFPQDIITTYDDWKFATSAYGPAWLVVCSFWSLLMGAHPLGYLLGFRLFGLGAHLLNTVFVATILKKLGRSPRTVTLGTLLYAWNPLALMESSLGGHNDTFMVTLILLGVLLCVRAEQRRFTRPSDYLPPVIAFTLATLIKFTAAPVIVFYIILLAYRVFHLRAPAFAIEQQEGSVDKKAAWLKILLTTATGGLIAFAFYAPFWIGHSIHDIIGSFSSPPSAYYAENSILRAFYEWVKNHGLPSTSSWTYWPLYILSNHGVWNVINLVALVVMVIIGAIWLWRMPTTQTLIFASLATLGVLLLVTPWFFSWYVTWLVGLAAACLPHRSERYGRALVAFAFTYSATAYTTYLFNGYPPIGGWSRLSWLFMCVPPIVVFLAFARYNKRPGWPFLSRSVQ